MKKENNVRYAEMCNLLKEYVNSTFEFPKDTSDYKGEKLGRWVRNQISAFKKNMLSDERIEMLNEAFSVWNGTRDEKERACVDLFIEKWNNEIRPTVKGIPVDKVLKRSDLLTSYKNGILTIDDLLENYYGSSLPFISKIPVEDILLYKYPNVDFKYFRLMNAILGTTSIEYVDRIPFADPEQMDRAFKKVLCTLTDSERFILEKRYIEDRVTLDDLSKILGLTRERIREIESKALRKLRHPSRLRMIVCKSVEEANMKKSGISQEQFVFMYDNEMLSEKYSEIVGDWPYIKERDEGDSRDIYDCNFSVRSYNCLKRSGINTVGKAVKVFEDLENAKKIRNLSISGVKEVYTILSQLVPDNQKIRENYESVINQ